MLRMGEHSWEEYQSRSFNMDTSSDKLPKQLLVFDPTSQYQKSNFCSHQEIEDVSVLQKISGGRLSKETAAWDQRMALDDPLIDKTYPLINIHEEQRLYIHEAHGHHQHPCAHLGRRENLFYGRISSGCNNHSSTPLRTCVDCNTTKTPLWRSGPLGPKSLCNACGIKHHKARRAKALAAAHNPVRDLLSVAEPRKKKKRADGKLSSIRYKRKNKMLGTSYRRRSRDLCFDDLDLNREVGEDDQYSENLECAGAPSKAFELSVELGINKAKVFKGSVFPDDEEQAAILLMALSCGLVQG